MNSAQRDAILKMVAYPGEPGRLGRDGFIAVTGIDDPETWALHELDDALVNRSADDVGLATTLGALLGVDDRWVDSLISVLDADWTYSHEDAAEILGDLANPKAVLALVRATRRVPEYLEYDEGRALAVKAIHSLGRIPGPEATLGLDDLRDREDRPLRECVERVIETRTGG